MFRPELRRKLFRLKNLSDVQDTEENGDESQFKVCTAVHSRYGPKITVLPVRFRELHIHKTYFQRTQCIYDSLGDLIILTHGNKARKLTDGTETDPKSSFIEQFAEVPVLLYSALPY